MKRFNIYWINKDGKKIDVNIIAATFSKALNYCQEKVIGFILDNVIGVYVYDDVLVAE